MKKPHRIEAGGIVGVRGKSRTRARDKDEPTPRMKEGIDRAREVHFERPIPPGVMVAYDENTGGYELDAPHRDVEGWEVHVCEAFATRSHAVMWAFLDTLADMVGRQWITGKEDESGRWLPNEVALNFALNVIHAEQPDTPLQAMLCAQMVATHLMQMKTAARVNDSTFPDARMAAISGKLARTFAMQMDTLRRAKGKVPTQNINVSYEQHVHHHHHQHAHMEGGGGDFGGQPQSANRNRTSDSNRDSIRSTPRLPGPDGAEIVQLEGRATVRSANPEREAVPVADSEGAAQMQDARMRARSGRTEG